MQISRRGRARKTVGLPDKIDFIEPQYRKISARFWRNPKTLNILLIITFILLSVRVVFMEGGYLDLQDKLVTIDQRTKDNLSIKLENNNLKKEIIRIKSQPRYQRKLAREHLGVISSDELLVLFETDLAESSR